MMTIDDFLACACNVTHERIVVYEYIRIYAQLLYYELRVSQRLISIVLQSLIVIAFTETRMRNKIVL